MKTDERDSHEVRAEFAGMFRNEGLAVIRNGVEWPNDPAEFIAQATKLAQETYGLDKGQAEKWAMYAYDGFLWPE